VAIITHKQPVIARRTDANALPSLANIYLIDTITVDFAASKTEYGSRDDDERDAEDVLLGRSTGGGTHAKDEMRR